MHHALFIHEILLAIFGHYCPAWKPHRTHGRQSIAVLASLARTCRAFKEPALDVLWSELIDLTPLAHCVPEACRIDGKRYSFERRLSEGEWAILRSYTRRVWHILGHANSSGWLDSDSFIMICSDAAATDPLFPNLRTFYWQGMTMIPPLHIAVPSLTTLNLQLTHGHLPGLKDFLGIIGDLSPNIRRVRIHIVHPHNLDGAICSHIQRLMNLRELDLRGVTLDADMILCLSKNYALQHLSLSMSPDAPNWIASSSSAFALPNLTYFRMASHSLELTTRLLSCIQLPVIELLDVDFTTSPSEEIFRSHLMIIRNACTSSSLTRFRIHGTRNPQTPYIRSGHRLTLNDVGPCMAFVNLLSVYINLPRWSIELTDSDILALVSAWPQIQTFSINDEWGWRTTSGITLRGLSQLLLTRPSISYLCIAINTESHANLPHELEPRPLAKPHLLTINVADSLVRPADVPALVEAFRKLELHTCFFLAWDGIEMEEQEDVMVYHHQQREWGRVFDGLIRESKVAA